MKRLLILGLFAAGFTAAGAAFACTTPTCSTSSTSVTQNINLTVPPVLKLVLDNSLGGLSTWTLDLGNALGSSSNCYAIPNQVSQSQLNTFIADAQKSGNGGLIAAPGYPAVFSNNGKVETWKDVVDAYAGGASGSPYLNFAGNDISGSPAKGNVVCNNPFLVEKYTNCPSGASFTMTLQPMDLPGGSTMSANTGYGAFEATDATSLNGTPTGGTQNTGWITTADASNSYPLASIQPGNFYDDNVSQWLWLQSAQPGSYALQATYTLADAVPTSGS
ncbi:MAG: hypothetical protein P8Y13_01375 [Deinococcales bacterium]|jgi:hypothetical protein